MVERLHGMQEVRSSNLLSSTPGQGPFSQSRRRAFLVLRGSLRGKIAWQSHHMLEVLDEGASVRVPAALGVSRCGCLDVLPMDVGDGDTGG